MEQHQHTLKLMSYLLAALISRASTFSANKRTQCLLKPLYSVDLVAMPEGPHPIPFRTRSLSLPGPMVLCLKSRESRSSPGLQNTGVYSDASHSPSLQSYQRDRSALSCRSFCFLVELYLAGWSRPVWMAKARQTNLKYRANLIGPKTLVTRGGAAR